MGERIEKLQDMAVKSEKVPGRGGFEEPWERKAKEYQIYKGKLSRR